MFNIAVSKSKMVFKKALTMITTVWLALCMVLDYIIGCENYH